MASRLPGLHVIDIADDRSYLESRHPVSLGKKTSFTDKIRILCCIITPHNGSITIIVTNFGFIESERKQSTIMTIALTQNTVLTTAPWQERARDKQQRILADVPPQFFHSELKFSDTEAQDVLDLPTFSDDNPARVMDIPGKLLTADELSITALNAEDIPPAIAAGTWTAVQVLDAFTHRAVIAHQLLHCCLAFVYPQARAQAEALDADFAQTKRLVGPLHGVPLSVKDQCRIAGTETTCGYVSQLGVWDDEDCLLVDILKKAGAVPFCKTTLSVGCMWGESINKCVLLPSLSACLLVCD